MMEKNNYILESFSGSKCISRRLKHEFITM